MFLYRALTFKKTSVSNTFGSSSLFLGVLTILQLFVVSFSTSIAQHFPSQEELKEKVESTFGDPPNFVRLVKDGRVWIDKKSRRVIADGYVVLRKGQLEMFACPVGSKEHESIVAVMAKAQYIHAALLAVDAVAGKPTQFEPYKPASGSTIKITVLWKDKKGKKHADKAQSWIRHLGSDKEMFYDWVFAGSGIYKDPENGQEHYLGDQGDLVCVANFPSATMDLAVRSSDLADTGLMFGANTDKIPEEGTPVRLLFQVTDDDPASSAAQ